jgi:ribosomal protein S18 acetylase RimI-like enzyme
VALTIRPASAADADGIALTFLDSAEHHAPFDPDRFVIPGVAAVAARYRAGEQHPAGSTSITFVAELEGEIAGFVDACLEHPPDPMLRPITYCYIAELAVRAGHRNRGVGRRLMAAAEDWGRRHGASVASLDYHVSNGTAAEFYRRVMGYRAAHIVAIKGLEPR